MWVSVFSQIKQQEDFLFFPPGLLPVYTALSLSRSTASPAQTMILTHMYTHGPSQHGHHWVMMTHYREECPLVSSRLYGSLSGRNIFPNAKFVSICPPVCQTVRPLSLSLFFLLFPLTFTHEYIADILACVYLNNKPEKYLPFPL